MRKAKHLLSAALVAAAALTGMGAAPLSATPAPAATAAAAALLPDGTYYVYDSRGNMVGIMVVRDGQATLYSSSSTSQQV